MPRMPLATRILGRTGLEASILGFGAEPLGRTGRSFDDAAKTLNAVLDMGITLIDTASSYGHSEAFIGRAIAHRKNEFIIVTKCGWNNDWSPAWSPPELKRAIDQSLKHLRVDVLDVLLLHGCPLEDVKRGESTAIIQQAQKQGKVGFIGYSGDNEALTFAVDTGIYDLIECSFSMLDQANAAAIERAIEHNIGVIIKRPIANAIPGRSEKPRSEYAAQYWPRWQAFHRALHPGSIKGSIDWLDTAIRFSAFWPGVSSVLVGSSHADHMQANAQALVNGPLPSPTRAALLQAYSKVGTEWPGLG